MTQKTNQNPWTMDVRVRERNLKSGVLTDKDVEKHLSALPDVGDQAEPFATSQPALAQQQQQQQQQQHAPVDEAETADDEDDDEEDEVEPGQGDGQL
jgi:hypothetical protein